MSCQHSTHPCEPSEIHVSRKKRYFGYVLQILTAISGCFELYRTFGKMDNFKDIMRVLMYSEFITMLLVLLKIIRLNFFWKEKNEELKVVLYVSECLRRFQVEEECLELYKFHHYSFYGGAIGIVVTCGCQIAQYSGDFNYVELLNRISLG
ncbi:hypothetical protein JTB14_018017 [Gonioctena quinquepunctata]|nr:hypothetical protein JTB14_018017 [Gonioctena quinquepunctata]